MRTPVLPALSAMTHHLLSNAEKFEWSIQGLGMLRLYLRPDFRLHVWDGEAKVTSVSTMHDHPWGFESTILSGEILNVLYSAHPIQHRPNYMKQQILCGPGGGVAAPPTMIELHPLSSKFYKRGDVYTQVPEEIHESIPADGTITVIQRFFEEDTEHANVFYPIGSSWVSAEPRVATLDEVRRITTRALELWPS